ncbi:interferon-gamma-inducible GTPase 10-like [Sardina pilchardus]|uniref:interferon-gamma-inducible GTPase 10-like n=1 Tax=Sardina pilchardus TaxID=27697 RepID=UPI002E1559FE
MIHIYENPEPDYDAPLSIDTEDEDFKEIIEDFQKNSKEAANSKVKEKLDKLENVVLNIAITGTTGAGKSSYVNAIRGVQDDDEHSAATGVTETTMEPLKYSHPTMANVQIWDLPGIGSPKFKAKQYLKDVKFTTYDFFIIMTSERFKENDIMLAKEIRSKKKLFYFVRSKIDNDIRSEMKKKNFNKEEVLNIIREDCTKNLKKVGSPKVFLVSSNDLGNYDFQLLIDTLEKELPNHKRLALIQSLHVCSMAMIDKKLKVLQRLIWLTALGSSVIAMAPVPGLSFACDLGIMISFFQRSFEALGLDDRSLRNLGERVSKSVEELKMPMKSRFTEGVNRKVVMKFFTSVPVGIAMTIECIFSMVPFAGALIAGGVSFGTVFHLLNKGLKKMPN